ncbi:MAG: hypothetical protein R6X34_04555, partial [Chloroflexota bacterium]
LKYQYTNTMPVNATTRKTTIGIFLLKKPIMGGEEGCPLVYLDWFRMLLFYNSLCFIRKDS